MSDSGKDDPQKRGAGPSKTPIPEEIITLKGPAMSEVKTPEVLEQRMLEYAQAAKGKEQIGEVRPGDKQTESPSVPGTSSTQVRGSPEKTPVPAVDLPLTSDVSTNAAKTSPVAESSPVETLEFYVSDTIPPAPVVPSEERAKRLTKKKPPKTQAESSEGETETIRRPVVITVEDEDIDPSRITKQRVSFGEIARLASLGEVTAHLSDPKARLYYLYLNKVHTDVYFRVVKGPVSDNFEAHKFYVRVCSPMFDGIIQHCDENNVTEMIFFDLEPLAFRHMMHFLYTDQIQCFDEKEVLDTHDIANTFLVDSLKIKCQRELLVMPFVPTNVLFVLQRSMDLEMLDVKLKCIKFIELYQTVLDLLKNEEYLSKEVLMEILKCPKLHIPCEIELLRFIIKWGEGPNAEKETLRDRLQDVVPYLRYDGFVASEFLELHDLEKVFTAQQIIDVVLYMAQLKKKLPSWCSTEYAENWLQVVRVLPAGVVPGLLPSPSSQVAPGPSQAVSVEPTPGPSQAVSVEPTPDPSQAVSTESTPGSSQAAPKKSKKGSYKRYSRKASKSAAKKTVRIAMAGLQDTSYRQEKGPAKESPKMLETSDKDGDKSAAQKIKEEAEELPTDISGRETQLDPQLTATEVTKEALKVASTELYLASEVEKVRKLRSITISDDTLQELHLATVSEDIFLARDDDSLLDPEEDTFQDVEEDTASEEVFQPYSNPDELNIIMIPSAELSLPCSVQTHKIHVRRMEGKFHVQCGKDLLILGATLKFKLQSESKIYVTTIGSIVHGDTVVHTNTYSFMGVSSTKKPLLLSFPEPIQLPTDFEFFLMVFIKFDIPRAVTLFDYPAHMTEISTKSVTWLFRSEGEPIFAGIHYTNELIWVS